MTPRATTEPAGLAPDRPVLIRPTLLVAGVAALALVLGVIVSSVSGAEQVSASLRTELDIAQAQRLQQDADMMHDALRADVLNAYLVGVQHAEGDSPGTIVADVDRHNAQLRADLDQVARTRLPRSAAAELGSVRPTLEAYGRQARILVGAALFDPAAARTRLPGFERMFRELEGAQARVTSTLAAAGETADRRARHQQRTALVGLVVFAGLALLGLLWLAVALTRLGGRVDRANARALDSERRFATLVDNSFDVITIVGADGVVQYDSPSVQRVLGYPAGARVGTPLSDYFHPDGLDVIRKRLLQAPPEARLAATDAMYLRHGDGSWRWVEAAWVNLLAVPEVAGVVLTVRDVTEQKELEDRLYLERDFLAAVLESLEEGVVACDADGVLTMFNEATRRFHGLPVEPLPAAQWGEHYSLYHPDGLTPMSTADIPLMRALRGEVVREAEMVIAPANGVRRTLQANGRALFDKDGEKLGAVVVMHDTTESNRIRRDLERQAFEDPVTGLGNRASLGPHLERTARSHREAGRSFAVLILDLDNFKNVNDSLGHAAGDLLLKEMGVRLADCLRSADLAVRLGGDEYAAVLADSTRAQATAVAERVLEAVGRPFDIEGTTVTVGASVGVVVSTGAEQEDGDRLLRAADLAMYVAKNSGKGSFAVFEPDMHIAAVGRLALEGDLRRALEDDHLALAYQPVVDLGTGRMVGVEALLRWNPPGQATIPPDQFIPIAEESGLIVPIGEWVLSQACAQATRWDKEGTGTARLSVAVNVSGKQLQRAGLVGSVVKALERSGLEPERLTLEITESVLMGDDQLVLPTLWELRRLGVRLSIDDFGTGYSSLSRLRHFPVDALKIDRSFVAEVAGSEAAAPLVLAILAMAAGLGLSVVAEGVETPEQLAFLQHHGCQQAQGYLMSRPVDAAAIGALLGDGDPLAAPRPIDPPQAHVDPELMRVIEQAVISDEDPETVVRPLLDQLERITGLESTYLTQIHWDRAEQEIRWARNTGEMQIPEGLVVDWSDTLCRRALLGEPANTDDVPAAYPDSEAARQLGLQTYVSVPIPAGDGRIYGTLCGASSQRRTLGPAELAVMNLIARLIADKVATR